MKGLIRRSLTEYFWVTLGAVLVAAGVYFFKFPNNFTFGGVSGLCVVLAELLPFTPGRLNLWLNLALLAVGWLALGRRFAATAAWATAGPPSSETVLCWRGASDTANFPESRVLPFRLTV